MSIFDPIIKDFFEKKHQDTSTMPITVSLNFMNVSLKVSMLVWKHAL